MAEKGIDGEYTEEVINMLGKGDQKSWSEYTLCCARRLRVSGSRTICLSVFLYFFPQSTRS